MHYVKKSFNGNLIEDLLIWPICVFIFTIKFILIRSYTSTDFEVHRNWMAITSKVPLEEWYYNNISQWTLDYPPFFAYFEWILSKVAAILDPSILALQSQPFYSFNTLIFQRLSVIVWDAFYFFGCISIANGYVNQMVTNGKQFSRRLKIGLFLLFFCNPTLLMLDNIHFQYNGFLYGIFLFSLSAINNGKFLKGAFLFSVLLNFKHLYLYYVPAFVGFYLTSYLLPIERRTLPRTASLGLVVSMVLCLSFGPFIWQGGIPAFKQILSRLFPFKRGLTHANWAPNFWVIYNVVDFLLAKIVTRTAANCAIFPFTMLKKCPPNPPEYTRGLVQEYSHSVLPDITPQISLTLVLAFLVPCFMLFYKKKGVVMNTFQQKFIPALALSAFAFYFFGWHVHEKAILMVFFPMGLLAFKDVCFMESFALVCISSTFAQFPLLFTPIESIVKWAMALAYFGLFIFLTNYIWRVHPGELVQTMAARILVKMMVIAELYASFGHSLFFSQNQLQYLPIMLTSFASSLAIFYSYVNLLMALYGEEFLIKVRKQLLIWKEKRILYSQFKSAKFDPNKIRHIAGVDLSHCSEHPSLGVVSFTVLAFPSMEAVYCADEFVFLGNSFGSVLAYIPEYLALRKSSPIKRTLSRHMQQCPKIDLLLVDSNGKWHSRVCGLACHVGYDSSIVTVGVAKNFAGFPLVASGHCEQRDLRNIELEIENKCKQTRSEATLFHFCSTTAEEQNCLKVAIVHLRNSTAPLFVSPGFGIDFDSAAETVFRSIAKNSHTVNPTRMSDHRSRRRIEEIYGC